MSGETVNEIVITGLGVISPVGANTEQTCTSIRAGISAFSEHACYACIPGESNQDDDLPLYVASVPIIDPYLDGPERLLQLAVPALCELINNAQFTPNKVSKSGFFLALPQTDHAVSEWELDSNFIKRLCKSVDLGTFKTLKIDQSGHTGMFSLMGDAIKLLQSVQLNYCIVGGVDSWLSENRLSMMDNNWRIRSSRNVDGFIPGEASVMVMLETTAHAEARGIKPIARISGFGYGNEPETITSDKVSTGEGLAEAISGVLQTKDVSYGFESVYCDLNGESYSAFEWGLMQSRLGTTFENIKKLTHPAENCGDVGAVSGGLLLACASKAFQNGYHIGDEALLWTASDNGERMALTVVGGG